MGAYKSKDIQEKFDVSKIQLSHWINMGAIKPFKEDRRRGGSHEFNRQNLIEAAICKELSDLRVPVKSMAEATEIMQDVGFDLCEKYPETEWFLVYCSPAKFDYKDLPPEVEMLPKLDSSKFRTFVPMLIRKEHLLTSLEYFRASVVLSLKRVFDLTDI